MTSSKLPLSSRQERLCAAAARSRYSLSGVFSVAVAGRTVNSGRQEVPVAETLAESDLRALLGVVEEARRDDPTDGVPWAALDGLAALVSCDAVSYSEFDVVHRRGHATLWLEHGDRILMSGDDDPPDPPGYWESVESFLPCAYPDRTGDLTPVLRWSDFYTRTELRNVPWYADFIRPDGFDSGMHAALSTSPGPVRKISFWRGPGSDFTDRDRLVVELLRPHLWEVYLDGQRRRHVVPRLSRREWEVLGLAHQGYDNAEIAARLFVSVATVRKHLEHVYDRTGVRSRAAAAALMMPHYDIAWRLAAHGNPRRHRPDGDAGNTPRRIAGSRAKP
jgi:DNA-binding CsgD family transcriptional regulator